MKKKLLLIANIMVMTLLTAQVGINTATPTVTLQIVGTSPSTRVEGLLIPRFTGDEIYSMPIASATNDEGNLVYAISAASSANQVGRGVNLRERGFFYWDGSVWQTLDAHSVTTINLLTYVKPMNKLMNDNSSYVYPTHAFVVPASPKLKLFDVGFTGALDDIIENNPLSGAPNNFVIWDSTNHKINVPQQLLGSAIVINVSLKFPQNSSNASVSRLVAYTGNAVYNATAGTVTGGTKIKDLMFKQSKTNGFTVVRDELVLSPIIITQEMITYGIKIYMGSGDGNPQDYYEPAITINYGLVNTAL